MQGTTKHLIAHVTAALAVICMICSVVALMTMPLWACAV